MTRDKKTGLTIQQKEFCERYIANGGNGTQAALDAGYGNGKVESARVRASEMLSMPKVKNYVNKEKDELIASIKLDRDQLLEDLVAQLNIAMARAPIPGIDTEVFRYDAQSAKSVGELLGRTFAMFTDKIVHTIGDEEVVHTVQRVLSRRLPPETVEEILTEIENALIARK